MDSFINTLAIGTAALASFVTYRAHRSVITVPAHEAALHYHHGKLINTLSPGRYQFWGRGHTFVTIDTRLQPIVLQTQELNTAEGFSVKLTAVGLYRIADPELAINSTTSHSDTLYILVQLALRDLVSGIETEALLGGTSSLGPQLLEQVQEGASKLGLEVTELTIRDVILPAEVKQALSATWRTKRESLAKLEEARGTAAALRTMANANKLYEANPHLLKLRYLEVLEKFSAGSDHTLLLSSADLDHTSLTPKSI